MFYPTILYCKTTGDWPLIQMLIKFSLENSVAKIVKWFGDDWKIIFGLMFSGELMTSLGDSLYLEIIFECFDMYVYERIRDPKFKSSFRRFKDYGDDGVLGYSLSVMEWICKGTPYPERLSSYLEQKFKMVLKRSDTYVNKDSDPRPDMNISSFFTQLNHNRSVPGPEIAYRGTKFLKRYIVLDKLRGGPCPVPWRPTVDYFQKAACVAGNNQSVVLHLVRLRALACDTYGTNKRAFSFLKRIHDHILNGVDYAMFNRAVESYCSAVANGEETMDLEDKNLLERIGGPSGARIIMHGFPSFFDTYKGILPDKTVDDDIIHSARYRKYWSPEKLMYDSRVDYL